LDADQEKRERVVWEIARRPTEDDAKPTVYFNRSGICWDPKVKGLTVVVNSIYNGWRIEDVWLDKWSEVLPLGRLPESSDRWSRAVFHWREIANSGARITPHIKRDNPRITSTAAPGGRRYSSSDRLLSPIA
jgi:hypothetical protein